MANVADITKPITAELDVLSGFANLVILEGPAEVSMAAQALRIRMTLESVDLVGAAKKSEGKAPCLQDDQRFVEIQMERAKAKSKMIGAATAALAVAEADKALLANEPSAPGSPRSLSSAT